MPNDKKNISILLIDDEPFVLDLTVRLLIRLGYKNIETARDGNDALGKLITAEKPFDILISDLNMPEMSGVEFMRHASNSGFSGGVILISGEDPRLLETAQGLAKAHRINILGALTKPLLPDALAKLLSTFEPMTREERHFVPPKPISERQLKDGIAGSESNQIMLVYQPKIEISTGEIVGVETLARWWNIDRGVLDPTCFIPLAEATGQIHRLTNEIYKRAVAQAAEWSQQGRSLKVAVNFSLNSFSNTDFFKFLVETGAEYGVRPDQIVIEVKETQAITIDAGCLEVLMNLRLERFGVSIDDFGTGNSSLAQLKNIPFSEMKIDRAFVHGAISDSSSRAILEASVNLARKLGMEIVAEGAETKEDWNLVEKLGCDTVQGYYCAKPMRKEDLADFLDNWSGPHQ